MKKRFEDPMFLIMSVLTLGAGIWAGAVTFTGLQTDSEAKETLTPIIADAKELRSDYQGFKVKVSTEIGKLQSSTESIDKKMDHMPGFPGIRRV